MKRFLLILTTFQVFKISNKTIQAHQLKKSRRIKPQKVRPLSNRQQQLSLLRSKSDKMMKEIKRKRRKKKLRKKGKKRLKINLLSCQMKILAQNLHHPIIQFRQLLPNQEVTLLHNQPGKMQLNRHLEASKVMPSGTPMVKIRRQTEPSHKKKEYQLYRQ